MAGTRIRRGEKWVIAFFGIRGLGSFYYIAYALGVATFQAEVLWTVVCLVVLVSIVMHGVFVTPTMHALDRQTEELASLSSGAIVTPTTTVSPLNGGLVAEPNGAVSEHAVLAKR